MFGFGFVVFLGLLFILVKLPRRWMLRLPAHDALFDTSVSALVLVLQWGTFEGVMAAAIAGLLSSLGTSAGKRLFGCIRGTQYFPGIFRLHFD